MQRRSLSLLFPVGLAVLAVPFAVSLLPLACSSGSAPAMQTDASTDTGKGVKDSSAPSDGGTDTGPMMEAGPWPTPSAWNADVPRPKSASEAASDRTACKFKRGDMPAASLDPSFPLDKDNPIEHVIVLMQENRSFDTYLGHLNKYAGRTDINSAPDSTTNPDSMGMPQPYQHAPQLCFADTDHSWRGSHLEWDNGKNDGFYTTNAGTMVNDAGTNLLDGDRALWWYDERDIPFYYKLYSTFAFSDAYHCALLGPTWPNRMYLYAATSFGETSNVLPDTSKYETVPTNAVIFDELAQRDVPFKIYAESSPGAAVIFITIGSRYRPWTPVTMFEEFFTDAKNGTLPPVSFIDPNFSGEGPTGDDEHPPAQIQIGQDFTYKVIDAVLHSPEWKSTALFITYDEHGGEYDHVPPPDACAPDETAPILLGSDKGTPGDFKKYGFRVPLIVISPYAKKAYVSHALNSHTSIDRFIEAKFKIPALSSRDANSDAFTDMFDWKSPPFMTPPSFTEPTVDEAAVNVCKANYSM